METRFPQQSQQTPASTNRRRPFKHEDYPCRRQQRSSRYRRAMVRLIRRGLAGRQESQV
ncbi:phage MS2 lysis protein family protein [Listeria monocytogenes]|uniref:phage MS2 lysis protein family protein n=1 Tax=Listeria monocytogenes TaxID=1639 RepID=UPI003D9B7483